MTKRLGALPVVAEFLCRLDVAGTVDALCPIRDIALATHGQVIEALVANRLTSPKPLVRVGGWARTWAVQEVLGIDAAVLNDDRLGRALDAIAPHLEQIVGSVGARAIGEFGIDVARMHWDMTSLSLHGAYPEADQDPGYAQVKYGHPKDRRVDLKQVQTGLAVAGDGGIPVFSRAFDGGAGEVAQVVDAITAMKKIAGTRQFLMVGDSKLISYGNLTALAGTGVEFIAPAPAAMTDPALFAALDPARAAPVEYVPARAAERPNAPRETYRVLEDEYTLTGPKAKDPALTLRRILVHSSANAKGQAQARQGRLAKARAELEKLAASAGGRYYKTPEKIAARVGVITAARRVGDCLHTEITLDENGRPCLAWHFNQQVLDTQAAADGWYALLAHRAEEIGADQILLEYKGQGAVERRYSDFKGPLAVAPVFLQDNRRINALIHVITLALLVYCLIERQVRRALGGDGKMAGLYPDNRRVRPTARMILYHLGELDLDVRHATAPPVLRITRGVQLHLLDLLEVEVTHPG